MDHRLDEVLDCYSSEGGQHATLSELQNHPQSHAASDPQQAGKPGRIGLGRGTSRFKMSGELSNQPTNQTPGRRWGTTTDASAVTAIFRSLSTATRSTDFTDWPIHSLMVSFQVLRGLPLRRLPSTKRCGMIFDSVLWRQTWQNHDNLRRPTVDNRSA